MNTALVDPPDTAALKLLKEGQRLHGRQQPVQAVGAFVESLRHVPENVTAWNNLAVVCSEQGRIEAAKRILEKCLWIEPLNRRALANFAVLLIHGGECLRARYWLQSFKDRRGAWDAELDSMLAHCDEAVRVARQAHSLARPNGHARSQEQEQSRLEVVLQACPDWPVIRPEVRRALRAPEGDGGLAGVLEMLSRGVEPGEAQAPRAVRGEPSNPAPTPVSGQTLEWPAVVDIEILTVCNIRCRNCYQQHIKHKRKPMISMADFERLSDRLDRVMSHANEVSFGSVEGLMHRDFEAMIRLLRSRHKHLSIPVYTNGLLLTPGRIRPLVDLQVNTFVVSLDGARKSTVEDFKTGVDFDRVLRNLREVHTTYGERVCVSTNFVARMGNLHELEEHVDLCESLGIRQIFVSGFIAYDRSVVGECAYSSSGRPDVDEVFRRAAVKAGAKGIALRHHTTRAQPGVCHASRVMHVDVEGNLVPCNILGERVSTILGDTVNAPERIVWGNVFREDPERLWNGGPCRAFCQALQSGRLPAACGRCPLGQGVICG